jgi:hypothetical protein
MIAEGKVALLPPKTGLDMTPIGGYTCTGKLDCEDIPPNTLL